MRNFPITDSHLHLWDNSHLTYPWLRETAALNQPYLLPEMHAATAFYAIDSIIFVQAECEPWQAQAEVAWVSTLAKQDNRIKGIVARAALENGMAAVQELEAFKKNPLVKGVRRLIQAEVDPLFCVQPDFIAGVQLLAEFDYSFDICIKAQQLPQVIHLVEKCPDVRFVLDHMGKPNIAENAFLPWQYHLTTLAQFPNVSCKISGLLTEANYHTSQPDDFVPYIHHAIEAFGLDRVMFGSDWPVLNLAANYDRWIEIVSGALKNYPEIVLKKFFSENAQQFYLLTITELQYEPLAK